MQAQTQRRRRRCGRRKISGRSLTSSNVPMNGSKCCHPCARAVLSFSVSFQNLNGWSRRDSTWQSCRKKRPRPKVQGSLHHSFLAALFITALATMHRDVRRCSTHLARIELATFSVLGRRHSPPGSFWCSRSCIGMLCASVRHAELDSR